MSLSTVDEDVRAWERQQAAHAAECRLAFLTGAMVAGFTILAFLILTGGP